MTIDEAKALLEKAGYGVTAPEMPAWEKTLGEWLDKQGYTMSKKGEPEPKQEAQREQPKRQDVPDGFHLFLQGLAGLPDKKAEKPVISEDSIKAMTPEQFNQNWDAIREYIDANGGVLG